MNLKKKHGMIVYGHPNMQIAQACLENVSPHKFWSISEQHPDLVSRLHIQTRLMGNFGLEAFHGLVTQMVHFASYAKWILKQ